MTSTDSFAATYVIASTTKIKGTTSGALPAVGDKVDVVAVVADDVATAKTISEHKTPKPKASASASAAAPSS